MTASKTEIHNRVIQTLENGRWRAPSQYDGDPHGYAAFCDEIVEDIHSEGFTPAALLEGMKVFRRSWKPERWPSVADLLDFLRKGQAMTAPKIEAKPPETWDGERWAEQVMRSTAGQRALENGYGWEMYIWAKYHPGQSPQDDDERQMRDNQALGDKRRAECAGGVEFGNVNVPITWTGFLRKEDEMRRRFAA